MNNIYEFTHLEKNRLMNNSNGRITVITSKHCIKLILKSIIHQTSMTQSINQLISILSLAMGIKSDKHSVYKMAQQ